jgi:hypothetical protein
VAASFTIKITVMFFQIIYKISPLHFG